MLSAGKQVSNLSGLKDCSHMKKALLKSSIENQLQFTNLLLGNRKNLISVEKSSDKFVQD